MVLTEVNKLVCCSTLKWLRAENIYFQEEIDNPTLESAGQKKI